MNGPFGIIRGEDINAYHANEAVSSTRLMDLRPSPAFYHGRHLAKTIPPPKSEAFDLGNAAHCLILEGRKALEERTVLQPATYPVGLGTEMKPWHNGSNYCKAWNIDQARAGKVVLTAADFATIDRMAKAVEENDDAECLLSMGEPEVTFRVQHPAFAVQCRADKWHKGGVDQRSGDVVRPTCVDLKTCDSIEQFRAHYFAHRYYYRAAFYQDVIADALGSTERPSFIFVAVEKNPPFRCEVFEPTEADLELGRVEVLADLRLLRQCIERNEWPNSKLGVQPIELTAWQRRIAEAHGAALFEEVA